MNKSFLLVFLSLVFISSSALAGKKYYNAVYIGPASQNYDGSFQGGLGHTRNTSDSVQIIGCSHYGEWVTCYATDQHGVSLRCSSNLAEHISAVEGISGSSHINVALSPNNDGRCAYIHVRTTSADAPK